MWNQSIPQPTRLRTLFFIIIIGFTVLVSIHFTLHKLSSDREKSSAQTRIQINLIHQLSEEIKGLQTLYVIWATITDPTKRQEVHTELTERIDQIFQSIRILEQGGHVEPALIPPDLVSQTKSEYFSILKPSTQLDRHALDLLKNNLQAVFTDIERLQQLFQTKEKDQSADILAIQQTNPTLFLSLYEITQNLISDTTARLSTQQQTITTKQTSYKIIESLFIIITLGTVFLLSWWATKQLISTSTILQDTDAHIKKESQRHKALDSILMISMQKSPLTTQLKKSLQILLEVMAEEPGESCGAIFVLDPLKKGINAAIQIGLPEELDCLSSFKDFSACLCGTSFQSGDVLQHSCNEASKCTTGKNRYCTPIGPANKPIGILMIGFTNQNLSPEKFTFLKFVSPILAGIILNNQYEQQLGKSELATLSIFQESDQAILLIRNNEIIDWNVGAASLFKAKNLQTFAPTTDLKRLLSPGKYHKNPFSKHIKTALNEGVSHVELRLRKQDGTFFLAALTFTTIPLHGEHIIYLVIQDISAKEAEKRALIHAKDEAEKASIAKTTFLTTMSHEILTPLNAILGITALTMKLDLSSETRENLEIIHTSSQSLRALVTDILDISKIEADQFTPSIISFSIRDIAEKLQQTFAEKAKLQDVLFTITIDPNTPDNLQGDPGRLSQVLSKLIANAFKYTIQGGVDLTIDCQKKSMENCTILFKVQDTGIGIGQENLQTVFNDFTQATNTGTVRHRGAGLGLTISKKIVEKMNGTIRVTSNQNQGSCFYVEITFPLQQPLGTITSSNRPETLATTLTGKNILVVEDSPINLKVTCQTLKGMGAEVFQAQNGEESITAMKQNPDAVLMDVEMPIMDGINATKMIRSNPRYDDIPIIAITAHGIDEDKNRCFRAGMNDYMTKPLEPEVLLQVLTRNLSGIQKQIPLIDHVAGIAKVGGDADFFNEILQDFCTLHGEEGELLSTLFEQQECKEIGERAHLLKGVAGTISATDFAERAKILEELCRGDELNLDEIEQAISKLRTCIESVLAEISYRDKKEAQN